MPKFESQEKQIIAWFASFWITQENFDVVLRPIAAPTVRPAHRDDFSLQFEFTVVLPDSLASRV